MSHPLYKELNLPTQHEGHAGLLYEKYGHFWKWESVEPLEWSLKADKDSPKLAWVNSVANANYAPQQKLNLLEEHHERMVLLCQQQNALTLYYKTTSRLVTGIGQDHPIENGFLWHPTLGVPYIPGSSIKGMLRSWLLTWQGSEHLRCWFEKQFDVSKAPGVGKLVFFDSLPCKVPKLEADIITPHFGAYYRDTVHSTPPADWLSPIPTPFLTVAKQQTFCMCVARRDGAVMQEEEKTTIEDALCLALNTIGIGAKTAVGYGRMKQADKVAPPARPDPLAEFIAFSRTFGHPADGNRGKNRGKQGLLADRLFAVPESLREHACAFLRAEFKLRPRDCDGRLKSFLFPQENP